MRGIPYFVNDDFLRTVNRDPYKLAKVEQLVDKSYETFLINECRQQKKHKRQLEQKALNHRGTRDEKDELIDRSRKFETTRCQEHNDLYVRGEKTSQGRR